MKINAMNRGIHYVTQLYRPIDTPSYMRLVEGLKRNLLMPGLVAATIFLDGCTPPFRNQLVKWVPSRSRASFADFLRIGDTSASSLQDVNTGSHILFANTDIVFDSSINKLMMALSDPSWAACLTRHELDGSFPQGIEPLQSQDAWMLMRQPISKRMINQMEAVELGVAGCEHLLAAALVAYGFDLWNPCEDCFASHTDPKPQAYGEGGDRYWGLYAYVPSCRIEDIGRSSPGIIFSYARSPGSYYLMKAR
jgi:hypothetical protein